MLLKIRNCFASSALKYILRNELIPSQRQRLQKLRQDHGQKVIGSIKVEDVIMGMRNMPLLLWDGSTNHPEKGITFKGHSIAQFGQSAQKAPGGIQPLPESIFFLLVTGRFPSSQEFEALSTEWKQRGGLAPQEIAFIKSLERSHHSMTMLSMSILNHQSQSKFIKAYHEGVSKQNLWQYYFEDAMDLLAKLPHMAALIYRHKFKDGEIIKSDESLDWAANYSHMLGFTDEQMKQCMRAYLCIHADHQGYNVSSHTSALVGSALSDPYLAYSAALNGLSGPLHGLANQECLKWLVALKQHHQGRPPSPQLIEEFVYKTLKEGRVIPGYGHAVLRQVDPRFLYLKSYADKHIKNDIYCDLASTCFQTIPDVMRRLGKLKNPFPNVDAFSGALLRHYGLDQYDYFTVCFGVSRAMGCLANGIWTRALGLPMQRPRSIDLAFIECLQK